MSVANLMGVGLSAGTAKLITGILADNLTATGTTQTDALPLPGDINVVAFVNGTGVKLPPVPQPGDEIMVTNLSGSSVQVYPSSGASIQGAAVNTPLTLPSGSSATFTARRGSLSWVSLQDGGTIIPVGATDAATFLLLLEEA